MTDSKPTTITAAEFIEGDYAAKIKAGECEIRRLDCVDYILEAMPYSQKGWIKLLFRDGWTAVEESDKFTVTWVPQADSAKPEGVIPETFDVDAFQHAIIDLHGALMMGKPIAASMVNQAQKTHDEIVADLQRELSETREQVRVMRAAATHAYNCLDAVYETFDGDLGNGLSRAIPRVCDEIKAALQTTAVLAGEGGA